MDLTSLVVVDVNTMPFVRVPCELTFHDNPSLADIMSS